MAEEKVLENFLSVIKFAINIAPEFKEQRGRDWIKFGEKNAYPIHLIHCYEGSSKHKAIITGKVNYIIGNGWEGKGKAKDFIRQPNDDENLMELSKKVALDLEIFNGVYIEVISSKGKAGRTRFNHIPFHRIRTNAEMTEFYYTKNWGNMDRAVYKPEENPDWRTYPAYDPNKRQDASIYYFQNYAPKDSQFPVYPLPEYDSTLPWIEADAEIADFHLNNIRSNFWLSYMINFYGGQPSIEEQRKIEKKFVNAFTGTRGKKFILGFFNSKETGAEILQLNPNQMDKVFNSLNDIIQQEIFTGHKVTSPMLFGVKTAGQLGGRTEMLDAYELFKTNYIQEKQRVIEDIFNYLFTGNRETRLLSIQEKPPVGLELEVGPGTLDTLFTRDELRGIVIKKYNLGLPDKAPAPPDIADSTPPKPKVPLAAELKFDKEKKIIELFKDRGRASSEFHIWKIKRAVFHSAKDIDEVEAKLFRAMFAKAVKGSVTDTSLLVLQEIDKNPDATDKEIAATTKLSESKVTAIIEELTQAGYLTTDGLLTDMGDKALPPIDEKVTDISIRYRYAKDPLLPGPTIIPTSRELCRELIGMDKLFTRDEIEQISNQEDYSVFLFRGGWYHRPDGEITPYCRHIWESVVVTERRGK